MDSLENESEQFHELESIITFSYNQRNVDEAVSVIFFVCYEFIELLVIFNVLVASLKNDT